MGCTLPRMPKVNKKRKLYLTGFGAFGGISDNPSSRLAT